MKIKLFISTIFFSFLVIPVFSQNVQVQQMTNNISGDSIFTIIDTLDEMDRVAANMDITPANYIKAILERYDADTVYLDYYSAGQMPNVVAIKYGKVDPTSFYVVGGHYDCVLPASGADDNASGTAGVMELLRVTNGTAFENTIVFVLFSAEEIGLIGSKAFADSICTVENIEAMFNMDMIAYNPAGADTSVGVCFNGNSALLLQYYQNTSAIYVPELKIEPDSNTWIMYASDHASFWSNNVSSLFMIETADPNSPHWNPYYHSLNDTVGISANSKVLAEYIVKSVGASLFTFAVPINVSGINDKNNDNSTSLKLFPNPASNLIYVESPVNIENGVLHLYSKSGILIKTFETEGNYTFTLNVEDLPSGFYFIVIRSANRDLQGTFVKK